MSTTNAPASAGPYYGWMRVIFTSSTAGALIKDWAYENSGSAIVTGRVRQGAASGGTQTVTLSPGSGESFTLGSALTNTGGNTNSVLKTGTGTVTLNTTNSYNGSTTINGGVLSISASNHLGNGSATNTIAISNGTLRNTGVAVDLGANRALTIGAGGATIEVTAGSDLTLSGAISASGTTLTKTGLGMLTLTTPVGNGTATLNATAGTTNLRASQTLASLVIGGSAVVTLSQPGQASELGDEGGVTNPATDGIGNDATVLAGKWQQSVPEPGSTALLLSGFAVILGIRVRSGS